MCLIGINIAKKVFQVVRAQKIGKHPIELKQDYPLVYEKECSAGFRDVGRCALGLAPGNRASLWVQVQKKCKQALKSIQCFSGLENFEKLMQNSKRA